MLKQIIIAFTASLVLGWALIAFSQEKPSEMPNIDVKNYSVKDAVSIYTLAYSQKYGVSYETLMNTMKCESSLNPLAVGDNGHSRGVAQIYDTAHPEITDEMAFDIQFSTEYISKQVADGNGKLWTCYRQLKGIK